MSLSLKIISFKGRPLNSDKEVVFDSTGGTIGRSEENSMVLPDTEKFVSRHHASITSATDCYFIKDTSLSGTYIDQQETPLVNAAQALADGMVLRIGEYEILVSIRAEQQPDATDADPFAPFYTHAPDLASKDPQTTSENLLDPFQRQNNPLTPFSTEPASPLLAPSEPSPQDFSGIMQEHISSIHDSFIPSAPASDPFSSNQIPDDFNFEDLFENTVNSAASPLTDERTRSQSIEAHAREISQQQILSPGQKMAGTAKAAVAGPDIAVRPGISAASDDTLFNAFLHGAGIASKTLTPENPPEKFRLLGAMFRQFVNGMITVLRSRTEFKSQFRVSVTTIKTRDNNPLKFAVTTEDALCHLLNNGQDGFKSSLPAIEEGFTDIISHQMAMQAGIQAALEELFAKFDPKLVEKQFEEGLVLQKKSKCWDKYVHSYPGIVEEAMEDFFGEVFSDAYEKQMKRLSGARTQK